MCTNGQCWLFEKRNMGGTQKKIKMREKSLDIHVLGSSINVLAILRYMMMSQENSTINTLINRTHSGDRRRTRTGRWSLFYCRRRRNHVCLRDCNLWTGYNRRQKYRNRRWRISAYLRGGGCNRGRELFDAYCCYCHCGKGCGVIDGRCRRGDEGIGCWCDFVLGWCRGGSVSSHGCEYS